MRRAIAVLLTAAVIPATPAQAATRARCSATLSSTSAAVLGQVSVSGRLRPAARRSVRLEHLVGRRWVLVARGRSSRRGVFSLPLQPKAVGRMQLRVRAPKSGRRKALSCRSLRLTVTEDVLNRPAVATPTPAPTPAPTPTPAPAPTPTPTPQFRAIYGLASDGTEDAAHPAEIASAVGHVNAWYARQTPGNIQPRWARKPDKSLLVHVFRFPRTEAEYAAGGVIALRDDLFKLSPTMDDEVSVIWMDVSGSACGSTVHAPTVIILPSKACGIRPTTADTWPFGGTYIIGHEMTHAFGAVPSCAPHHGGGSHVNDDTSDVLYSGPGARNWANIVLDPGHDDYFMTGNACGDILNSPFWTKTSDPAS